ncbi:amino acid adenylation domain-containing protein [Bacillus subtilis]|nr:non-ribosomal peptide synthetase [Bacillus subtilis]MDM5302010.1 amino acid adenylation domain-containing protein [Bacillus subtilis]MDM5324063.1 amino acid adenylation domain-containing protein [Bacillus subtilis]
MSEHTYSLTHAQRRVWFTELLEPGTGICNLTACVKFRGNIDLDDLEKALNHSISRNDAIRFQLLEGEELEPRLYLTEYQYTSLGITDFSNVEMIEIEQWIQDQARIPFKLFNSPLYQFYLLRIHTHEVWLFAKFHHIIMDGISLNVMGNQIIDLYQKIKKQDPLPDQPQPSYLSYIEKESQYLQSSRFAKDRLFWSQTFQQPPEYHSLAGETSLQKQSTSASRDTITLSPHLGQTIRIFCEEQKINIISLFMASFYICISRITSKKDLAIGTYYGNRGSKAEKEMLGMFVSSLPIRITVDPDEDFLSFVHRVGREQLSVMRHQRFPYNLLVNELRKDRKELHNLIGISMQYQPLQWHKADGFDYETALYFSGYTANELSVQIQERIDNGTIHLNFDYQNILFSLEDIKRIQHHLLTLLENALQHPHSFIKELDMTNVREKQKLLNEFNKTEAIVPKAPTLHGLFERQAACTPKRPAIRFSGGSLTYAELDMYASRLSARLAARGVTKESIVGVLSERSPDMLIAVLAVLKAGGAYLPLDPAYPEERLSYMLKDSGAALLLTQPGCSAPNFSGETLEVDMASLANEKAESHVFARADSGSLAYVIYTSGSTGQPKGVAVEHRNAVSFLTGMQRQFPLQEDDIVMVKTSFSFDASVWQLFWWALSGASAYLLPPGWEKDPALIVKSIHREKVTTVHFIPAMLNSFLDQAEMLALGDGTSLKRVFAGGEPLAPHTAARFASLLPQVSLIHGYGPTEATVDAAFYVLDPERDRDRLRIPIGKPVPGARLYVLDLHLAVQPCGVAGELYIAGAGVARGYLNRPALTEERFLEDPFYPGERMYKTGDLARWLPDGNIEFLGRLDDQVKIRGYRIEPGEIEATLRSIEGVREAAVTVRTDSGEPELCAYAEGLGRNEVRAQLETLLPGYMIPSHMIEMEEWPVTPSGKLDRKALPAPDGAADEETYTAPRNVTEMKLAQLWEDVLKNGPVGIHDNFFDRGGHSLKATALVSRIAKEFDVQVPLKDVFAHPTVEGLASVIREGTDSTFEAIKPAEQRETYPVSSAQKRIYVLQQLEDGGTGYNMPAVLELEGKLDPERLDRAFQELIKRHESLRTSFEQDEGGDPVQRIHDEVPFTLQTAVLGEQTEQEAAAAFIQPFDLSQAPLFRAQIVQVSDERHLLMVDMHHIISDGVSVNILIREFGAFYNNRKLPALHIQYKDYAVWQEDFKKGDAYQKQEAYWLKQFEGELPVLDLPADHTRPPVRSFAGDKVSFTLDQEAASGLHTLARENGSTLYMVLLAAYTALLSRLSGQEEIIVGSPIAGRPHKDLEPILGMFVNTLALRTRPEGGKPFGQYLQEVRATAFEAYEHQDYPFEELVDKLGVTRDMSRNPVFDAMFILQNTEKQDIELEEIKVRPANFPHHISLFDMTFIATETDGAICCEMEFSTEVFLKATVERWAAHFSEFLHAALSKPETNLSQINILSEKEKQKIAFEFNKTQVEFSQKDVPFHRIFEARAEETPEHIAVIDDETQISYRILNEKANRLARTLQKRKGTRSTVAVLAKRSIDAIVGILAVMKAGGVYIPIDSHYPKARIEYILRDSGADILLLQQELKHLISNASESEMSHICLDDEVSYEENSCNLNLPPAPEDAAYIIYTSGTTGAPKGVIVTYRNFTHAALAWRQIYELDRKPVRLLQIASFSFDVFSGDLARTLTNGGTLIVCPDEKRLEPAEIYKIMSSKRITMMESTPALIIPVMEYIYRNQLKLPDLDILILGSDMVKAQDFKTLTERFGQSMRIINSYGVTEATIDSSFYETSMGEEWTGDNVPIGSPLPNVRMYVLSQTDQIQPIGVAGELCIGGAGVAKGYHNKPDLTRMKFTENPFVSGERLYRTGDRACFLPNGTIRLLGRMDYQVKINGYRIETEEIESVLLQTGLVREAAVTVQHDKNGQAGLSAYIVPSDVNTNALRTALTKELPAYMIPAHLIALENMPLTLNGKLDRNALPAPDNVFSRSYTAPVNDIQKTMAYIWEDVLSMSRVGIHDSFFELGGDSIKALQVAARLAAEGWSMTIRDLFRYPTIQELSGHITPLASQADQGPAEGEANLTPIQRRFFGQAHAFHDHYNQSVMLFSEKGFNANALRLALRKITEHHDAIRMVFQQDQNGHVVQYNRGMNHKDHELFGLHIADWTTELLERTHHDEKLSAEETVIQRKMNVQKGPLLQAGLFKTAGGDHLLIALHHLVIDGVSWRILLEDLAAAYQQALEKQEIQLPPKTDSYLSYASGLAHIAENKQLLAEKPYWQTILDAHNAILPKDTKNMPDRLQLNSDSSMFALSGDWTEKLLFETQKAYGTDANELLLTALGLALSEWTGHDQIVISTEGHGREGHLPNIDISRTVGWFTSIYPILLDMSIPEPFEDQLAYRIKTTKDMLRRVPNKGTGYGLLTHIGELPHKEPEVSFNYLGQFSEEKEAETFQLSYYQPRYEIAGEREREYELDINALITDGRLQVKAVYTAVFSKHTIECFMDRFHRHLIETIEHCSTKKAREKTLSDFSNKELTLSALSSIENLVKDL